MVGRTAEGLGSYVTRRSIALDIRGIRTPEAPLDSGRAGRLDELDRLYS
jgi:hypothetical protein